MRRLVGVTACTLLLAGPTVGASTAAAQSDAPKIRLLDPGSGPLEPLRLNLAVGKATTTKLTTELKLEQTVEGESRDAAVPPIALTLTTAVSELTPEGDAVVTFSYDDSDVENDGSISDSQLKKLRNELDKLVGISGSIVVSPTGSVTGGNVDIPSKVPDQTRALLQQFEDQVSQLAVPFPEEPVGKGARWEVSTELELSGIDLRQIAKYTLKERTAGGIRLAVKFTQRAPRQEIDNTTLLSHKGTGGGTADLRFDEPLPRSSTLSSVLKQRLRASGQTLDQTTTVEVRAEPAR